MTSKSSNFLNTPAVPRNNFVMGRAMLALVCGLVGCTTAKPVYPPPTGSFGTINVVVHDHVRWPYRLERIMVMLDGKLEYHRVDPGQKTILVGQLGVVDGVHVVASQATVSYASGSIGDRCHSTMRSVRSFSVDHRPASLAIDIHAEGPLEEFPERPGVTYAWKNVSVQGEDKRPDEDWRPLPQVMEHPQCNLSTPTSAAMCRIDATVARGRATRDVVLLVCANDKRVQVNVLARMLDQSRAAMASITDPSRAAHEKLKLQVLEQRIQSLGQEVLRCAGDETGSFPIESFSIEEGTCRGREAILDDSWDLKPVRDNWQR